MSSLDTKKCISGLPILLLLCLSFLPSGCGPSIPKGVVISGKIVKGGQALVVQRRDIGLGMVELRLAPTDGVVEDPPRTLAKEDGSFSFVGAGRGVKPGKYKFAIFHRENGPPGDSLNGAFSEANSPITIDVPAPKLGGTLDLGTIDLDNPPATLP